MDGKGAEFTGGVCNNNTKQAWHFMETNLIATPAQKRTSIPDIKRQLLSFEEALAICLSEVQVPLETEPLPLMASLGRLSADILYRHSTNQ